MTISRAFYLKPKLCECRNLSSPSSLLNFLHRKKNFVFLNTHECCELRQTSTEFKKPMKLLRNVHKFGKYSKAAKGSRKKENSEPLRISLFLYFLQYVVKIPNWKFIRCFLIIHIADCWINTIKCLLNVGQVIIWKF